ncbi:MAG: PspA/IM30 family protein [Lachnospiraceae bacterium]
MGILKRCNEILEANIHSLLDRCEDPAKMAEHTLRKLEKDLQQVKAETASVISAEKQAERAYNASVKEQEELTNYAESALKSGNEDDARTFLSKKVEMETKVQTLYDAMMLAKSNSKKMVQMYDKLLNDIAVCKSKLSVIKAKSSVVTAQTHMNRMISGTNRSTVTSLSDFERWNEKLDTQLDTASAITALNGHSDNISELKTKYNTSESDVDELLIELKKKLQIS